MQEQAITKEDYLESKYKLMKKIDFSFLKDFTRPKTEYTSSSDPLLLDAYRAGIYDVMLSLLGESHLKITGVSQSLEEVQKFLRQSSFNGELTLTDNDGKQIKTVDQQEETAKVWFKENIGKIVCTHLILMIPKDNDRNKLTNIVNDFFKLRFNNCNYIFVEHTDTDIFHYHVIVGKDFRGNLLKEIQADFISVCMKYETRLL